MSSRLTFQQLSQSTSIYEPDQTEAGSDEPSLDTPTTVLIFGWMGSTQRHLTSYASKYSTLYPFARIITVTSAAMTLSGFYTVISTPALEESTVPAVTTILADPTPVPRLLVHALSNGGGFALAAASRRHRSMTGSPLPARAVIFDSTPGGHDFRHEWSRWVKALSFGLPANPLIRWPAQFLMALLVGFLLGVPSLFGYETAPEIARRDLNDETLISHDATRLYLYSKSDELIGWEEVEQHASDAVRQGLAVTAKDFGTSAHVRHAITHPEGYWAAVVEAWDSYGGIQSRILKAVGARE